MCVRIGSKASTECRLCKSFFPLSMAAYTEVHAVDETYIIHVLWVQTTSKSAILRRSVI